MKSLAVASCVSMLASCASTSGPPEVVLPPPAAPSPSADPVCRAIAPALERLRALGAPADRARQTLRPRDAHALGRALMRDADRLIVSEGTDDATTTTMNVARAELLALSAHLLVFATERDAGSAEADATLARAWPGLDGGTLAELQSRCP